MLLTTLSLGPGWLLSSRAAGHAHAADEPQQQPAHDRIYANGFLLWIYERPERDPAPIGVLRAGQVVQLRRESGRALDAPIKKGCGKGWFAVHPAGYVCLDGNASFEETHYSRSMAQLLPAKGAYPFEYALSMGTPSYRRVPQATEWEKQERIYGAPKRRELPPHWRGHEELATNPQLPIDTVPSFLTESSSVARTPENRLVRRAVPFGSMLALTTTFEANGRRFGQSADGTVVPMDRMLVFEKSEFEGVELTPQGKDGLKLPLAWPRKEVPLFKLLEEASCTDQLETAAEPSLITAGMLSRTPITLPSHCLSQSAISLPRRTPHSLTGRKLKVAGANFVELAPKSRGQWLNVDALYMAELQSPPSHLKVEQNEKWLAFTIGQGTLTAYEGRTPVFSTLASPGIGGVPNRGADALSTRTTPVGTHRISFKYRSDDMSPEQTEHRSFWIAEVPYAMYFQQPFAIHVAYWHQSFGEPMSGGCINVSPKDGARLFSFTDPPVPETWYGAGSSKSLGLGTTIVVRP